MALAVIPFSFSSSTLAKSCFWISSIVPWPGSLNNTICYIMIHCYTSKKKKYLYFNFVWDGKSLLEYCTDNALRSFSPRPWPPRAGSNVGRAAVVISRRKKHNRYTLHFKPYYWITSHKIRLIDQWFYNEYHTIWMG